MERTIRFTSSALMVLASATLLGCSAPDGRQASLQRLSKAISEATRTGPVTVRYNPSPCDCPPFEMWVQGMWIRLQVMSSATDTPWAPTPALEAGRSVQLELNLDSAKPTYCANGTAYYSTSYSAPDPVEPGEPAVPEETPEPDDLR